MDTLEVFKHARPSPEPSLGYVRPLKQPIFRIKIDSNLPPHWGGFHGTSVFFLDDDVALKLQNQFPVAELDTTSDQFLFENSLYGFYAEDLAKNTLARLEGSPCKNLGFLIDVGMDGLFFSERLTPLTAVWAAAPKGRRRRWAVELASAFAHLEMLGLMPLKTHARDIGVDRTGRLKLVGYETSPRRLSNNVDGGELWDGRGLHPTAGHQLAVELAHQSLACCLYYVMSGVDMDSQLSLAAAKSREKSREKFRQIFLRGDYPLDPDASVVVEIIRGAWEKRLGDAPFTWVAEAVRAALEGLGIEQESELPPVLTESHYDSLRAKCREWADAQVLDPKWMGRAGYKAECEKVDYPI